MRTIAFLALLIAPACGSNPESSEDGAAPVGPAEDGASPDVAPSDDVDELRDFAHRGALYVASLDALPECTRESDGWLIYVADQAVFKACISENWETVDVRGERGERGETGATGSTGATGPAGAAGADGGDERMVESLDCVGAAGNATYGDPALRYSYSAWTMNHGGVLVMGSIITTSHTYSATKYYDASSATTSNQAVKIVWDPGGTYDYFTLSFSRASDTVTVRSYERYFDAGLGAFAYQSVYAIDYARTGNCVLETY